MTKVTPALEEPSTNINEDSLSFVSADSDKCLMKGRKKEFIVNQKPPLSSIKCLLISLVVVVVVCTVLLLTTIWISCFSASITSLSQDIMFKHFSNIVTFTNETLTQVLNNLKPCQH